MRTVRGNVGIVGAVVLAALLTGCVAGDHEADARRQAQEQARARLTEVTAAIARDRPWEADEFGRLVTGREGVDLMSLDGTTRQDGDGVSLVVRVRGEALVLDWNGSESARAEVTLCHRLGYRPDDRVDPVTEVDCPPTAPITPRPAPSLPSGTDERLRRSLPTGPAATERSVGAAVDRLRLDPRVRRDVATVDGAVGLALREGRRGSCLLARVVGDRVEVWRPPTVLMQPGELTCDGRTAALGLGQRDPS
ncbi:hypothetical protein [Micromonospora coxensis]|nr:hypothetical protein [Micromonospora coxensis]